MALIKCPDCEIDVSNKAVACPKCGCPLQKASIRELEDIPPGNNINGFGGASVKTIQMTSKDLKMSLLWAYILFFIGLFSTCGGMAAGDNGISGFGITLFFVGIFWYIVSRVRIWWHHE